MPSGYSQRKVCVILCDAPSLFTCFKWLEKWMLLVDFLIIFSGIYGQNRYMLHFSNGDQFLLSARKHKKNENNYVISLDEDDMSKNTGNYFGKVSCFLLIMSPLHFLICLSQH
jgi:hypothetical protein